MGKIADSDYEELLLRYRAEAKRLLRAVDEDLAPARARAAAYVAEQLGGARKGSPGAAGKRADRPCPSCRIDNDFDAVFCKKCGARLAAASKEHQDASA